MYRCSLGAASKKAAEGKKKDAAPKKDAGPKKPRAKTAYMASAPGSA